MPYINLQILGGASTVQKRQVVEDFTASLVNVLGKSPEHIHIVIQEIAPENWGYAGGLTAVRLAATTATPRRSHQPTTPISRPIGRSRR